MKEQYLMPFFTDEIQQQSTTISVEDEIYKDIAWDYENNTPLLINGDFLIIEGLEAVKSWTVRALQVKRGKQEVFTWNYGLDIEKYVGKVLTDKNKIDIAKEITESLLENPYIENITDFKITSDKRKVEISFKVITKYGEFSEEVKLVETI